MKIFHGTIITCDWDSSVYQYLVEDEGKIAFAGNYLPNIYANLESADYIELEERALLPAFGDGHIHFSQWALFNSTFDVRSASSIEDTGKIMQLYAANDPQAKMILGFGHNPLTVKEKRLITRPEMDRFIKDKPAALVSYDGHSAVANSKAIGLLPYKIRELRGLNLETGLINSEAYLKGTNYLISKIPLSAILTSLINSLNELAVYGVGLVHTVEGIGYPKDRDVDLVRFITKGSQIRFRTYLQTMDLKKVKKRNLAGVGGCFDCALDGSFGLKDAALLEPYTNDDHNNGTLFYSDGKIINFVKKANRAGLQVQLHCIGDAAVVQAVKAIEAALEDYPREDHRHTLIHACLIPDYILEKIAELGIGISLQPGFLVSQLEPRHYLEELLGNRAAEIWPLKKLMSMGINISGGSDGPVTNPDPLIGIYAACNHPVSGCSLDLKDALAMYTYNIAHTSFDEKKLGSLEAGKEADMIILNKNPYDLKTASINDLKVEKLYLSGEEYSGNKTVAGALFSSLKTFTRKEYN